MPIPTMSYTCEYQRGNDKIDGFKIKINWIGCLQSTTVLLGSQQFLTPDPSLHLNDCVTSWEPWTRITWDKDGGKLLQRTIQTVVDDFIGHLFSWKQVEISIQGLFWVTGYLSFWNEFQDESWFVRVGLLFRYLCLVVNSLTSAYTQWTLIRFFKKRWGCVKTGLFFNHTLRPYRFFFFLIVSHRSNILCTKHYRFPFWPA